jgi:fatty acid desaturase
MMSNKLLRDPRLRSVDWQDLTHLNPLEVFVELLISVPWLLASLYLAGTGLFPLALVCSFFFFLTGLRQVHSAYHYTLGLSRRGTEWVMFLLSVLMLGSMHAIQRNHLRHHKDPLGPEDVEGESARYSPLKSILVGPRFAFQLQVHGFRLANRGQRQWIVAEWAANLGVAALVFFVFDIPVFKYHLTAMLVGQCLSSFFAVWTVHHDLDPDLALARTLRQPVLNRITYNMFFHVEHHLYPQVPTSRLPELARRLDEEMPELREQKVLS